MYMKRMRICLVYELCASLIDFLKLIKIVFFFGLKNSAAKASTYSLERTSCIHNSSAPSAEAF
jgi:hypothetical protein